MSELTKAEILTKKYSKPYTPIIKDAGFNPSPIAGNIPYYANSMLNKDCIGTTAYNEFWEEQLYYCLNGYWTGGMFIPPKYYHYLNYTIIFGVKGGKQYPYFVDLHYDLFTLEHEIRNDTSILGMTIPKARRKGLSFFGDELINYGVRFIDGYRAGVAAGLKRYTDGFRSKLYNMYNNTIPEFKLNTNIKNDRVFNIGYTIIEKTGEMDVVHGLILFETMQDEATKLEGEYFHDAILEECGEFEKAEKAIVSILPALMDGNDCIGKFLIPGTGGNMAKGGKTFSNIYHSSRYYQLVNFFIPGKRYYPPTVRIHNKEIDTPNLDAQYPDLKPEQLLGCEDIKHAQHLLDKRSAELSQLPDKKKFIQHKQNYPNTVEDVFMSSGSNNFDTEKLYSQNYRIDSEPVPRWTEYTLHFITDKDGIPVIPLQVEAKVATSKDPEWKIVKIYKKPDEFSYLDVCGIDGYNEDKTTTGKSLGGITVVRDMSKLTDDPNIDEPGIVPILIYYSRPPKKEQFFDIALKVAVYCRTIRRTNVSAEADLVIEHFKKNNGTKYLSKRPKKFDSPKSKKTHEYGTKMDAYTKPRMVGLLQSWVDYHSQYSWFKELNEDVATYDDEHAGDGDWDLADSLGLALVKIYDMNNRTEKKESDDNDILYDDMGNIIIRKKTVLDDFPIWKHTEDGKTILVNKKHFDKHYSKTKEKIDVDKNEEWKKLPSMFKDDLD